MKDNNITEQDLLDLFGERETDFDVFGGTVRLENYERQVFITTETIYGLYKSLSDETGEAWQVVMKNCGYLWGKRVISRIEREMASRFQKSVHDISVSSFLELVQSYFAYHGWGRLHIHLEHAQEIGVIRVQLKDSIVTQALREASGPADYLVAGMLRAIFEFIASRELDCIQISSNRTATSSQAEFLLSAVHRIEAVEPLAGQSGIDEAIREIQAA